MKIHRLAGSIRTLANIVSIIGVKSVAKVIGKVKTNIISESIAPQSAINTPENFVAEKYSYISQKRFIKPESIIQIGIQFMPVIISQKSRLVNIVSNVFPHHSITQVNVMFI